MSAWLRVHGQALADGARRVAGQPWASLAAMAVMALAVALPILAGALVGSVAQVSEKRRFFSRSCVAGQIQYR